MQTLEVQRKTTVQTKSTVTAWFYIILKVDLCMLVNQQKIVL